MKIIIAGGRDFKDYDYLKNRCDDVLHDFIEGNTFLVDVEIVSGGARGADSLGERYAAERGYPIKQFLPDWDKYGKAAGYKRNAEMAKYADTLIAFWDEKSRGTKHMIDLAREHGLKTYITIY